MTVYGMTEEKLFYEEFSLKKKKIYLLTYLAAPDLSCRIFT